MTIAPPLNMNPYWLGAHPSYTLSKYGMTLLSLGWAAEYADAGIGFSCLWPETYVATTAVANSANPEAMMAASRSPDIMADSAVAILSQAPSDVNGKCYIDVDVLAEAGVDDLSRYGGGPTRSATYSWTGNTRRLSQCHRVERRSGFRLDAAGSRPACAAMPKSRRKNPRHDRSYART